MKIEVRIEIPPLYFKSDINLNIINNYSFKLFFYVSYRHIAMIKVQSQEWKEFISKIELIKTKSNREVLCLNCWQMLNCKQKIKHLRRNPEHEKYLLTSTKYASEKQILSLAATQSKLFSLQDGEYMVPPYGPMNKLNRFQGLPLFKNENFMRPITQNEV